jgi:uncharacterized membrane protein YeaQ/YmgE (transglycosylase-associated protein family)
LVYKEHRPIVSSCRFKLRFEFGFDLSFLVTVQAEALMLHGFIWWIIVGGIAGWLAGKVMKGGGFGVLIDILLGIVGSMLGGWLFGMLGLYSGGGLIGSILVAFVGACILLWLVRVLRRA